MGNPYGEIVEVTLNRDCPAVMVPWGSAAVLRAGSTGTVSQRLGGTITVMVEGNLYRVPESDADALGLESLAADAGLGFEPGAPVDAATIESAAWRLLGTCYDPEIPIDIVNLGLVYGCIVSPMGDGRFRIDVRMTLTAAGCGMGTLIADEARVKLEAIPGVAEVHVDLVWDPPWSREMMSESAQLEMGLF